MKHILLCFAAVAVLASCKNTPKTESGENSLCKQAITVDSFLTVAANHVGQNVVVTGTIDHVCKHGGKRAKMFSTCPDVNIHATLAEGAKPFDAVLEGSSICVSGKVVEDKIDVAYLDEWEAKIKEAQANASAEADMEHKAGADHHATLEKIQQYRADIEAGGKGFISFYSIEVAEYEACETGKAGCCSKTDSSVVVADTVAVASKPCCASKTENKSCGAENEAKPCGAENEAKPCSQK